MPEAVYRDMPPPPSVVTPGSVLARLVDGIGFRLYWATEGLREEDADFRACESSMSIREVMRHIWEIAARIEANTRGEVWAGGDAPVDFSVLRTDVLARLTVIRERFLAMNSEQIAGLYVRRPNLPEPIAFWAFISGPLADMLTHVGQINTWRRLAGIPPIRVNYLLNKVMK